MALIPWHQDANGLCPAKSVTVWLALYDTDEENAAMKVVKGSHKQGMFKHRTNKASNLVLDQRFLTNKQDDIISLNLRQVIFLYMMMACFTVQKQTFK